MKQIGLALTLLVAFALVSCRQSATKGACKTGQTIEDTKNLTNSEAAQDTLRQIVMRKHLSVDDYVLWLPSSKG